MTQVFISYSRKDLAFVRQLACDLEQKGLQVWWDVSDLVAGEHWSQAIESALRASDFCIVVLSPAALDSEWVAKEYTYALGRKIRVLPIFYKDCEIPLAFTDIHIADFRSNPHDGLEALLGVLRGASGSETASPAAAEWKPPKPSRSNLPLQLTGFIGREREIEEIKQLLQDHRLVTLTGAGGTGKSRLALQVAAQVLDQFQDGVWLVELAPITDATLIPPTVLRLLGLNTEAGRNPLDVLKFYLTEQCLLIILDNCEHLLDACCSFVDAILKAAPQIKIMPTSREALNLVGEVAYRVPSLSTPDVHYLPPAEQLTQFEAVRLVTERAVLVSQKFAVTDANAAAVAQICQRLDGIPLAIELAAARIKSMPLESIVSHLDDRFRLLTGGSRAALPRQQTLRALIDWSYNLLSEPEKLLLQRLSVFRGGRTLEAAEAVCSGQGVERVDVLDLMSKLVDKSLLSLDEHERYRMLETVRQYAADKLIASGQAERARDQHLSYILEYAEEAEPHVSSRDQLIWLNRLDAELDNIRAAMQWAQERNPEACMRIASALWRFWFVRQGYLYEGIDWLTRALKLSENARTIYRARALERLATLGADYPDVQVSERYAREAYELSERLQDRLGMARALLTISWSKIWRDDETALALATQAQRLAVEVSDDWAANRATAYMGVIARERNNLPLARSLLEKAINLDREAGDPRFFCMNLMHLGMLLLVQGDPRRAEALLHEAWPYLQEAQDFRAMCLNRQFLADTACSQEHYPRADQLLEEAYELGEASNDKPSLLTVVDAQARLAWILGDPNLCSSRAQARFALSRELGSPEEVRWGLFLLAEVERWQGHGEQARRSMIELLPQFRQGEFKRALCFGAENLGHIALLRDQPERAACLFAIGAKKRETLFWVEWPFFVREREKAIAEAKAQLGEEAFNKAWAEGQAMTEDEMLDYALADGANEAAKSKPGQGGN